MIFLLFNNRHDRCSKLHVANKKTEPKQIRVSLRACARPHFGNVSKFSGYGLIHSIESNHIWQIDKIHIDKSFFKLIETRRLNLPISHWGECGVQRLWNLSEENFDCLILIFYKLNSIGMACGLEIYLWDFGEGSENQFHNDALSKCLSIYCKIVNSKIALIVISYLWLVFQFNWNFSFSYDPCIQKINDQTSIGYTFYHIQWILSTLIALILSHFGVYKLIRKLDQHFI